MNGIWFQLCSVQSLSLGREARTPGAAWATVATGTAHYIGPGAKWECSFSSSSRCPIGLKEEDIIPAKFSLALCREGGLFYVDGFPPDSLHILNLIVMSLLRSMSHNPIEIWIIGGRVKVTECALLIASAPTVPCVLPPFRKTHGLIYTLFMWFFLSKTWVGHDKWDGCPRVQSRFTALFHRTL